MIPETETDGWRYGAITEFEDPEGCEEGDGFVVAPDGSRAGLVWSVGEFKTRPVIRPIWDSQGRWGVYAVAFPRPVRTVEDLVLCFRAVLPELKRIHELSIKRRDLTVLAFNLVYLTAAVFGAFLTGNSEFIIYAAVMALIILGVGVIHLRVRFPEPALWALSVWGAAHMAGGTVHISEEVGVLYNLWLVPGWLKYDQLTHAYGFGVATWACWLAIRVRLGDPRPTLGVLVLCALAGMGLGALNEVVEFAATKLVPDTNVGGYDNTGWDLLFNLLGCALAVTAIRLLSPARPP